jgi:copper oxidase (laccase) domain-containing protein
VGREFRDHFRSVFFSGKNGKTYFDLAGPLRKELENSGVPGANVEDSGLCTHCHPEICHSHRRDRTIFRHAALMMLS